MRHGVVALVGRPNVGKSTLFNAIVGKKIAITEDVPGITRDRVYSLASFEDNAFHLVDTGGIVLAGGKVNEEIKMQVDLAIADADMIIFVVDGKEGLQPEDFTIRDMLFNSKKPILVAINKADTSEYQEHQYDFYELGLEAYFAVSGEQKDGLFELLDYVVNNIPQLAPENESTDLRFSLIGRPNVGKSSLVNALLDEKRIIVSDEPGTTRDAIDTVLQYDDKTMVVIDTAGVRRRGKIAEKVEKYSLLRTIKAIDRSDVCVVVLDAETGIVEQDKHIVGYALSAGRAIVLAVNKWDIAQKNDITTQDFTAKIRREFAFIPYASVVFLSAVTKKRLKELIPLILQASENAQREIPTNVLNNIIRDAFYLNPPPSYKNRHLKLYFSSQVDVNPPRFNIQVNDKGLVHFSYARYLENKLRENFDFRGTPIILQFKNKGEERQ